MKKIVLSKKKLIIILSSVFILISLVVLTLFPKKSNFLVKINNYPLEKTNKISKADVDYYKFSLEQKNAIDSFVHENGNAGLLLQFKLKGVSTKVPAYTDSIGFLYQSDFNKKGKLLKKIEQRPLVTANFYDFKNSTFKILFSFSKSLDVPVGFFIKSKSSYKILYTEIVPAKIGFDYVSQIPLYAYSANGGFVEKDSKKIDLSGVALSLAADNSDQTVMPKISFFIKNENSSNVNKLNFTIGGERFVLRLKPNDVFSLPMASLKSPFSSFELSDNQDGAYSVLVESSDNSVLKKSSVLKHPIRPIKSDPGLIIDWPQKNWRSKLYELYEWDKFNGVLIFDFSDYKVQDDFLLRLAYFTEKKGYRGKLLTDEQLKGKHGYNAHDYSAIGLEKFFNAAAKFDFPLNKYELLLKEILIENSILKAEENGYVSAIGGAIVSICRETPLYNRNALFAHEGWHGIYFIDEEFRNVSASIYYTMDKVALNFLLKYFNTYPSLSYDVNDVELMKNEFMAYMLQRPVSAVGKYFVNIANWKMIQENCKQEADYIINTEALSFVSAASMFDEYVNSRWNLNAGRIGLINRQ